LASARPIPELPPVISTTFSFRSVMNYSSLSVWFLPYGIRERGWAP
jgi:hypothetical protein